MIYLDYSATSPVDEEVLKTFNTVCRKYIGNANSFHKLGSEAKKLEIASTSQIKQILDLESFDIIYTSGSSESNNLAIKGLEFLNRKHIITTNLEHSSIYEPLKYLEKKGFIIDYVKTIDGLVDINHLKELITDDTLLVSICAVNSETGILQDIEGIANIIKDTKALFHVDATQAIGKVNIDYKDVDMISFSAHKFYGLKGIGVLAKKKNINLEPLIHGGKSTTNYRSGTPAIALIASISKSLRLAVYDIDKKYKYVLDLNNYLKNQLSKYEYVNINSNNNSIPHILNFSVTKIKPETLQHALEEDEIYISTKSACSSNKSISRAVLELTNNHEISSTSVRVSISYLTTKEEIDEFLRYFDICYKKLIMK